MLGELAMISVRRQVSQAFLNLTGNRKQLTHGQHEPDSRAHNMVVSSRSSRGRRTVQTATDLEQHEHEHGHEHNEHNEPDHSDSSSPQSLVRSHDHDALLANTEPDDASSSRSKRSRIASVSDHESIQKRRRLARNSDLPSVHIPLRGRAAPDTPSQTFQGSVTRNTAVPPPLVTHDSSISNSPLNSPAYRPQYDQFKRIEEKAQKVVKKSIHNEGSKDDKRTLRSEHGSTRSKTELAQYFPAFDDMLSLEPADPALLVPKTPVILLNDTPSFKPLPEQQDFFRSGKPPHEARVIDLEQHATASVAAEQDPLGEAVYYKAHQKAERHEKQMKNGDKERAQHEKYQLERLLEELRGPDWLKTLGISGITDTEKKRYEVKRALFIRETKALIDKFRRWKEEEKRRKSEKQQRLVEEAEAIQTPDPNDSTLASVRKARSRIQAASGRNRSRTTSRAVSTIDDQVPDSRELDDLASQQLLEEAKLATLKNRKANNPPAAPSYIPDLSPRKPFTSFFEKEHIRDAAMSGRNRGRKSYAFGIEVPDLPEQEFELPDGVLTDDTIRASQRMRRRARRSLDD